MVKTVFKEIIILIPITLAIVFASSVLFYNYMPTSKIVPETVKYEAQENIIQEIEEKITENDEEVIITYQVDSKDLNVYEKNKDYNAGNPNPFSYYTLDTNEDGNIVNTDGNSNQNNNNNNSDGTIFQTNGIK